MRSDSIENLKVMISNLEKEANVLLTSNYAKPWSDDSPLNQEQYDFCRSALILISTRCLFHSWVPEEEKTLESMNGFYINMYSLMEMVYDWDQTAAYESYKETKAVLKRVMS